MWVLAVLVSAWLFSGFEILNGIDQLGFLRTGLRMELYEKDRGNTRPEAIESLQAEIEYLEKFVKVNEALAFFILPAAIGAWLIYSRYRRNNPNLSSALVVKK
jgi:hypothetical protein